MNASARLLSLLAPLLGALAALSAPAAARADGSLRCSGGIVSVGDGRLDLLAKCGPPALRDSRVDDRWVVAAVPGGAGQAATGRKVSVVVDEWSYDFGTRAFTYVVRLENGRIVDFVRGNYGHSQEPPPGRVLPARARCDENAIHEGDTKLDVVSRCGEPAVVDAWDEAGGVLVRDGKGFAAGSGSTLRVERWTYDLGRNRLLRIVRFEDGRVVKVGTGSYGYAD